MTNLEESRSGNQDGSSFWPDERRMNFPIGVPGRPLTPDWRGEGTLAKRSKHYVDHFDEG